MFGTGFAIPGKQFAEMLSRAVQLNGEVISRQAKFLRSSRGILAIKIDALEQFTVVLRNGWQQALEALTKNLFSVRIGRFEQFILKLLKSSISHCVATVKIDDGMSQNPVKPSDGILVSGRLIRRFERLHKTFLNHVLRQMRITDAATGEGGEGVEILDQGIFETTHALNLKLHMRSRKAPTRCRIENSV